MTPDAVIPIRTVSTAARPAIPGAVDLRGDALPVGLPVEVRSRFDDRWNHGFSVAVVGAGGYQLRRLSDGSVLPAWFPAEMIRADRRG